MSELLEQYLNRAKQMYHYSGSCDVCGYSEKDKAYDPNLYKKIQVRWQKSKRSFLCDLCVKLIYEVEVQTLAEMTDEKVVERS